MTAQLDGLMQAGLDDLKRKGLLKGERVLASQQRSRVLLADESRARPALNLCANNYLGLADDAALVEAAASSLRQSGFGMASVRFICGTHREHKALEDEISTFLGREDTILFGSCFDANAGLFEALLDERDAIISDQLNHASIIDGVRLSRARRYRYANNDMADLEAKLKEAGDARLRVIATDGVFSMDGIVADLPSICDLAERYDAVVMVDDSHAVGFVGEGGRGTPEHHGVSDRVHIVSGTLGKALGGALGGYVSASGPVVAMLRQKSRPYLFSNALPPMIASAARVALRIVAENGDARRRLAANAEYWRAGLRRIGYTLAGGGHPIVPVMLGDETLAVRLAARLGEFGVLVSAFSFPVVPIGTARIRTQISAALTRLDLDEGLEAFAAAGRDVGAIA